MYGWHRYDASQRPLGSRSTRPPGGLPGSGALEVDEQHVFVSENKVETSLLRLTPIENLSVVQDGQALGQARFDLVLAHEHVLLVDLERTAPGQASGGAGGTAS